LSFLALKKVGLYKLVFFVDVKKITMGKHCALFYPLMCENWKVHYSKQAEDIAYCNVVRANRYTEDYKTDVKAGRESQDLDYGTLEMEEGPAKEAAKAEGKALATRYAEVRESHLEKKRKTDVVETSGL